MNTPAAAVKRLQVYAAEARQRVAVLERSAPRSNQRGYSTARGEIRDARLRAAVLFEAALRLETEGNTDDPRK